MDKIKYLLLSSSIKVVIKSTTSQLLKNSLSRLLKKDRMLLHFTNALLQVILLPESSRKNKCWNLQKEFLRAKVYLDYNR